MTLDEQVLMVLKILRLFAVKCKSQLFSKISLQTTVHPGCWFFVVAKMGKCVTFA